MILANRNGLKNTRNMLRVFGGLNETYSCTEAEYSAGHQLFGPELPGPEHPSAPSEAAGDGRAERDVSPERPADGLRHQTHLHSG